MQSGDYRLSRPVGAQIKAARQDAGLTQNQLAERIGVTRAQLGQWETLKRNPRKNNLDKISSALGMSSEELMNYTSTTLSDDYIQREIEDDPLKFKQQIIHMLIEDLEDDDLDKLLTFIMNRVRESKNS